MLRVTFYSYKGGVGRTLALLNVATLLARAGRKVVMVDLDLEAPGLGLTASGRASGKLGVSDFCFDVLAGNAAPVRSYMGERPDEERLWQVPCGTRALELSQSIAQLYADPTSKDARLFEELVDRVHDAVRPDYVFFDSRTGHAEISGVCTIELPELLVALTSLGEQSVGGLELLLEQLRHHPARAMPIPTLGVLSPVPRAEDLGLMRSEAVYREIRTAAAVRPEDARLLHDEHLARNAVYRRLHEVQGRILPGLQRDLEETRGRCGYLDRTDLLHSLEYDPAVPLGEELQIARSSPLVARYRRLALSIERAAGRDESPFSSDAIVPSFLLEWPSA